VRYDSGMLKYIFLRLFLASGALLGIAGLAVMAIAPAQRYVERYYAVNGPEYHALSSQEWALASCMTREVKVYTPDLRVHLCNQ
jgi:hypothetical protein